MTLSDLEQTPLAALHGLARQLGIPDYADRRRRDLMYEILEANADTGAAPPPDAGRPGSARAGSARAGSARTVGRERRRAPRGPIGDAWPDYMQRYDLQTVRLEGLLRTVGVLETLPDGYGFLRSPEYSYLPSPDDIYVSPSQIKRFSLRLGDTVDGQVRPPKEGERFFALIRVHTINGRAPEALQDRTSYDHLTPDYPDAPLRLETTPDVLATRIVDLVAPIGKGQRGLIVAPPESGRTTLIQQIATAVATNDPETRVIVLLVDERPEEARAMARTLDALPPQAHVEVIATTFDDAPERQTHVAELVLEKARRLVEARQDVVLLVDSITRLARAYADGDPAAAIRGPKRLFGAARAVEEGGSLTVIGTALAGTGRASDAEVLDEFRGSGNMELVLSAELAEQHIWPAIDLAKSRTRREEMLVPPDRLARTRAVRRDLTSLGAADALRALSDRLADSDSNAAFLDAIG